MSRIIFANRSRDARWVSSYSHNLLLSLMHAAGVLEVVVTSSYRSPEDQARVMYANLTASHSRRSMYKPMGQQVEAVYRQHEAAVKTGLEQGFDPRKPLPTPQRIQQAMAQRIHAIQDEHGVGCVSSHQCDPRLVNVFDLAASSIQPASALPLFIRLLTESILVRRIGLPAGLPATSAKHFRETSHCLHLEIPQPFRADVTGDSARNLA